MASALSFARVVADSQRLLRESQVLLERLRRLSEESRIAESRLRIAGSRDAMQRVVPQPGPSESPATTPLRR